MKKGLLYVLFLMTLASAVVAEYYPYDYPQYPQPVYPGYGYGGYFGGIGGINFDQLYDRYHLYIDAIVFGFIFFGLGSIIWGGKPGHTPLFIGLGLFMTVSLLLFEARTCATGSCFRILDVAGPWAVGVLALLLALFSYKSINNFIDQPLISGGIALILTTLLLDWASSYLGGAGVVTNVLIWLLSSKVVIFIVGIALIVVGAFRKAGVKKSS